MNIYLTPEEREMVREQRARLYNPLDNRARSSIVLRVRADGEVEVVYAYSRRWATKRLVRVDVMAVAATATDASRIHYRNLLFCRRAGYRVDSWSAAPDGMSQGWLPTRPNGVGEIPGPVANPWVLASAAPCYRHAGIDERCWDVRPAAYLRMLRECPAAELLYKAGFSQLLTPAILKRAAEIAPYIARHRREIDALDAGASAVLEAWRKGLPLEDAVALATARTKLRGIPRAPGADILEIARWFDRANRSCGVSDWEYRRHCEHCKDLGLAAEAYMPSPRRFRAFAERVEAEVAEARRRKERLAQAKIADAFRRRQLDAASACPRTKGAAVLWPDEPRQLEDEGRAMRNCIGNGLYARAVAKGASLVLLLREEEAPESPWVDVELRRSGGSWRVAQCYARGNETAPDKARRAANNVAAALNRAERKSRAKKGAARRAEA